MLSHDRLASLRRLRISNVCLASQPCRCEGRWRVTRASRYLLPLCERQIRRLSTSASLSQLETSNNNSQPEYGFQSNRFSPNKAPVAESQNVRDYLRRWSVTHQQQLEKDAPEQVQAGRGMTLPNSLFAREIDKQEKAELPIEDVIYSGEADEDDIAVNARSLQPGDAFFLESQNVRSQLALCLGRNGVQSQFLLSDGRWYVDTRSSFGGHFVHDFATEQEMSRIRTHLPIKPVTMVNVAGGPEVTVHAKGDVPLTDCSSILGRFNELQKEVDDAKRLYAGPLERMYDKVAAEAEYRRFVVKDLVKDQLHINFDSLDNGAKVVVIDKLAEDERYDLILDRQSFAIMILPKRMDRTTKSVTLWARQYQDAAARAASGKDVTELLQHNPLTHFISKARRLIAQSRKIRSPTTNGLLGTTVSTAVPKDGNVERKPTGEIFNDEDKQVIEFLWLVYVKIPVTRGGAADRSRSLASLILRAVGAYPKFDLERQIGQLFLQEIGCLDPWFHVAMYNIAMPLHTLGLNETAKRLKEAERAALAQLDIKPDAVQPPFPDTMAHLRKDWGDMEVFTIDGKTTRVVDDGISVEASKELPDHYWMHIHIAHPSAFIPTDHVFHQRALFMGGASYSVEGSEPCLPYELLDTLSVAPNRPVITCSTLMSIDGTVKDIQMVPGVVRNVIKIDKYVFDQHFGTKSSVTNEMHVGFNSATSALSKDNSADQGWQKYMAHQTNLMKEHQRTFELLQSLTIARWEARMREAPIHLTMQQSLRQNCFSYVLGITKSDKSYDRLFRSEHCYGDPTITVVGTKNNIGETYSDQEVKRDPLAGAMLLASESMAAWTRARGVPVIYRYHAFRPGYGPNKLNNLRPGEPWLHPESGESLFPSPHVTLHMAQQLLATSPLRRVKDMINYYQVDAYLRAQDPSDLQAQRSSSQIEYPYSRDRLQQIIKEGSSYKDIQLSSRFSEHRWKLLALFRAFHFNEAKLPDVWDMHVDRLVSVGKKSNNGDGQLLPFAFPVVLEPSEQGWEKQAKPRQFLPVKIQMVDLARNLVRCFAVGPPTNAPMRDSTLAEFLPTKEIKKSIEQEGNT